MRDMCAYQIDRPVDARRLPVLIFVFARTHEPRPDMGSAGADCDASGIVEGRSLRGKLALDRSARDVAGTDYGCVNEKKIRAIAIFRVNRVSGGIFKSGPARDEQSGNRGALQLACTGYLRAVEDQISIDMHSIRLERYRGFYVGPPDATLRKVDGFCPRICQP